MSTRFKSLCALILWGGVLIATQAPLEFAQGLAQERSKLNSLPRDRWLWVNGVHPQGACQAIRPEFEEVLKRALNELSQVSVVTDPQELSCAQDLCARARLIAASGSNAILGESACVRESLQYTLQIISTDPQRRASIYRKTLKPSPQRAELRLIAYQLARRALYGSQVPHQRNTPKKRRKESRNWASLGSFTSPHLLSQGTGIHLEGGRLFKLREGISARLSALTFHHREDSSQSSFLGLNLGLRYHLVSSGFSPQIGGGLTLGYQWYRYLKVTQSPLDNEGFLLGRRLTEYNSDQISSLPWVEAGGAWMNGSIRPSFTVRYYAPQLLGGLSGMNGLSLILGFEW